MRIFIASLVVTLLMVGLPLSTGLPNGKRGGLRWADVPYYQAASTRRMAQRLSELGKNGDKEITARMPNLDLAYYLKELTHPNLRSRIVLDAQAAYDLLTEGKSKEAALEFFAVKELTLENSELFEPGFLNIIRELLAISYLRAGEKDGRRAKSDADPCVLMISDFNSFTNKDWSKAAIAEYLEILHENPTDLTARWLLNLAYISSGDYPRGVPREFLIPPKVFKSDYEIKRFRDIAPELGLNPVGRAGGAALEDFDGDGYVDVMFSSVGLRDQLRYFRNNADGSFTEHTQQAGLAGITGGLNISTVDYNNDGFVDVFVPRGAWLGPAGHHPSSLLRNNGDGTFDDVTEQAGLLSLRPSQTAVWADYNNDGQLDLFLGAETIPGYNESNPCQLYQNNGDGTFTDVAEKVGLNLVGWVKGAAWGDYDNDGLQDLYVSRLFETNLMFHNDGLTASGQWKFTDITASAGVAEPLASYPCWFTDYDNDGWLDIFVSSCPDEDFSHVAGQVAADYLGLPTAAETPRLFRNNHNGTFADVTRQAKLNHPIYTMGANFGDLDNDGNSDFYLGTGNPMFQALMPNRMFRNVDGKYFQDVTASGGFGHLQKGHGIAFGDIDNDGDQDILLVPGGVYPGDSHTRVLFENPGHGNNWLTMRLEGVKSNRFGVGARIEIQLKTRRGRRIVYTTAGTGGSFGSSTLQQEIGLGQATGIEMIKIIWPGSNSRQVLTHVRMNGILKVREGDTVARPVRLKKLIFAPKKREITANAS